MPLQSRLYRGTLWHCRHTPKRHAFRYRVFMPLVDIARLPELVDGIPFWSARRWAPARFLRQDFLGDPSKPLIEEVRRRIFEETGDYQTGDVLLLANWRYFGLQSNPIACYFCFEKNSDQLSHIVAEVTNTPWHERHSYVLPITEASGRLTTQFSKEMHVSPFNPMNMTYHWSSTAPGDTLSIKLSNYQAGNRIFDATLSLHAQTFSRKNLLLAIVGFPLMTAKVTAAIYWEALRLWLKGIPLYPHPKGG